MVRAVFGFLSRSRPRRFFGAAPSFVLLITVLTACAAPKIYPMGDQVEEPRLTPVYFRTADAVNLPYRAWRPEGDDPKAILIAVHGFNDYSRFFDQPGRHLASRGILTYAYDQRGFGGAPLFGRWAGGETYQRDLAAFAALLRVEHPGVPVYALGESFGGAVVMTAMTGNHPPDVDGIILSAPAVWGRAAMAWYEKAALWIAAHTMPWLTVTGQGLNIQPSDNIPMLIELGRDPLVIKATRVEAIHGLVDLMDQALASAPLLDDKGLILYGAKDEIIPGEPTFSMVRRLPPSARARQTFALYEDGYHMLLRDLSAATVMDDVAAWILAPGAGLPSGADRRARRVLADGEVK